MEKNDLKGFKKQKLKIQWKKGRELLILESYFMSKFKLKIKFIY